MLKTYTLKISYLWVAMLAALYLLQSRQQFAVIPDYGLVILLLLLSIPFYQFSFQWALLRRRAFLAHLTSEQSVVRGLLWDSHIVRVLTVFPAVLAAVILLLTITAMRNPAEWGVLVFGLMGYLLLLPVIERKLSKDIAEAHRRAVAIRTTFWLVLVVIVVISTALWVAVYSVPDVRHMDWQRLVALRFEQGQAMSSNMLAGYLLGLREAIDGLVWYFMQSASGSEQVSATAQILGWVIFALYQAVKLSVVLLFFVSFLLLARHGYNGFQDKSDKSFGDALKVIGLWHFLIGIGLILIVWAGLSFAQRAVTEGAGDTSAEHVVTERKSPQPCTGEIVDPFVTEADEALVEREATLNSQLDSYIAAELNNLFMQLERGIDPFLDWNFSMRGQYTMLVGWAAAQASDHELDQAIHQRFMEFAGVNTNEALESMAGRINATTQIGLQRLSGVHAAWLESEFAQLKERSECEITASVNVSFSDITTYSGVGTGAISSAAVLGSARLAAFAAAARRAVTRAFARRGAVRGGQLATGAKTGALCGPLVVLCAPAIFVGTDYALIKAVELRNREAMREQLLTALHDERQRIEQSLTEQTRFVVHETNQQIRQRQDQQFNILRDGLTKNSANRP